MEQFTTRLPNQSIAKQILQVILLISFTILLLGMIRLFPIPASDWPFIWEAARRPWTPYEVHGYYNPPWVAGFFIPLGMIPYSWSLVLNRSAILVTTLLVVRRSGGGLSAMLLALTSAPFVVLFANANIDWLPMLALLLPYETGLIFLMSKPQGMFGLLLIWWHSSEWDRRWKMIALGCGILLVSLWIWGMWPLTWLATARNIPDLTWNISSILKPYGMVLGLCLLIFAWFANEELYALTASIFLTPYLSFYSFTPIVVVLIGRNRVMGGLVWGCLWILHLVMRREAMGL